MDFNLKRLDMDGTFTTFTFSNMRNGYRGNTHARARAFGNGKERRNE